MHRPGSQHQLTLRYDKHGRFRVSLTQEAERILSSMDTTVYLSRLELCLASALLSSLFVSERTSRTTTAEPREPVESMLPYDLVCHRRHGSSCCSSGSA